MDGLLVNLLAWYLVFLFSTSLHEAAHAVAAAIGGDCTASGAGQATLNPVPHIKREKLGMVVVPLASFFLNNGSWMFGWASAPFNPFWAARYPKRAFVMSLAGPLSHLVPAVFAWAAMVVGMRCGWFAFDFETLNLVRAAPGAGTVAGAVALILSIMFRLNLILCIFNLLPLPPMDGSEVWYLFAKSEETRLRMRHGVAGYGLAGLLLAWYVFPEIFRPVYRFSVQQLLFFGL